MDKIIIGIIKEGKNPPDSRVPLTPFQCRQLLEYYPQLEIYVQKSPTRCYTDQEYLDENITLTDDLSHCDIIMGVKEVPIEMLLPNKRYLFFSHTIKAQPYNRDLLQAILDKNIALTDYECLRWQDTQKRILGFGRFAGIVGAHNGLRDYGIKTATYDLTPAHDCKDYTELKEAYKKNKLPAIKIVVTGGGRVAKGALELLKSIGATEVDSESFLTETFEESVYTKLDVSKLYRKKEVTGVFERSDFYQNPQNYVSIFEPYTKVTDLMINGVYWDPRAPLFFSMEDMKQEDFYIKVIADVTCDVNGSIPATVRSTKIGDSTFGYDPHNECETKPYQSNMIDIMAVDNLPNELPRYASQGFGIALSECVIPELLSDEKSDIIDKATIAKDGILNEYYTYLQSYVDGNDDKV